MTRFRSRGSASMTLVLVLGIIQTALAQSPSPPRELRPTSDSADRSYKIYSLDDFGNDPSFCEWVAQTIPEVIATGTWKGPGLIRYYAPKNILVVCHTSAVQAQVESFLKDVKKSLPETTKAKAAAVKIPTARGEVVPIVYKPEAGTNVPSKFASEPSSYPVPAQRKSPKHLFHFIIRYEGEGIVDDNIVKAMKDYYRAQMQAGQTDGAARPYSPASPTSPAISAPPAPPAKEKEEKKDDNSPY